MRGTIVPGLPNSPFASPFSLVRAIVSGRLYGFSMTRSLQAVAYCRPSVPESAADGQRLGLETSRGATPSGVEDHPRFFAGFLTFPQVASAGLLAVADVAATSGSCGPPSTRS